jgi:hypothetical protein
VFVLVAAGAIALERRYSEAWGRLRRANVRGEALWRLAATLNRETDPAGIAARVLELVPDALGTDQLALGVIRSTSEPLDWLAIRMPDAAATSFRSLVPAQPAGASAVADAIATGLPVIIPSQDAYRQRYPSNSSIADEVPFSAAVVHPLSHAQLPFGVLVLAWDEARRLRPAELSFVATVSEMLAENLRRASAYATAMRGAEILQRTTVPPKLNTRIGAFSIAASYLPTHMAGGDWYDVLELPNDRILLSVGDVVGHGLAATEDMVSLRHATRALAAEGHTPAGILRVLNQLAAAQGALATCLIFVLDPLTGTIQVASAGHPPPLTRRDGDPEAQVVAFPAGPIVGAFADAAYTDHAITLDCDALFVLYTDGLIERRGQTFSESLEQLRLAAASLGPSVAAVDICAQIELASLPVGVEHEDDICILCLVYQDRPDAGPQADRPPSGPPSGRESPGAR